MFKCCNCNSEFIEPIKIHTTYSAYLGIEPQLGYQSLTLEVCPYCESEEIEEHEDEIN